MLLRLPKLPQRSGRGVAVLCDGRDSGEWFEGTALLAMRADRFSPGLGDTDVWIDCLLAKTAAGKRADWPGKLKQIAGVGCQDFGNRRISWQRI